MVTTYWWIIDDESDPLCGEEFFTELQLDPTLSKTEMRYAHNIYVHKLFPYSDPRCLGRITEEEAEMMGLDTY